jgi:hypothetical protein
MGGTEEIEPSQSHIDQNVINPSSQYPEDVLKSLWDTLLAEAQVRPCQLQAHRKIVIAVLSLSGEWN